MTDLNSTIAEMRARTENLVPGPWTWGVGTIEAHDYDGNPVVLFERESNHVTTRNECAFIAHARTDLPKLLTAVETVVALHINLDGKCVVCKDYWGERHVYPCPTISALESGLEG